MADGTPQPPDDFASYIASYPIQDPTRGKSATDPVGVAGDYIPTRPGQRLIRESRLRPGGERFGSAGQQDDSQYDTTEYWENFSKPSLPHIDPNTGQARLYNFGDIYGLASLGPERIGNLQADLVRAGYIDARNVQFNNFDAETRKGLTALFTDANVNGKSWEDTLRDAVTNPPSKLKGQKQDTTPRFVSDEAFTAGPYVPPDYDSLTQKVKDYASKQLGYDIPEWEVKLLADHLGGYTHQAYDAKIAAERQQFDAAKRAKDSGNPLFADPSQMEVKDDPTSPGGKVVIIHQTPQDAGVAPEEVDPAAKFRKEFEDRRGASIRTAQTHAEFQDASKWLLSNIATEKL